MPRRMRRVAIASCAAAMFAHWPVSNALAATDAPTDPSTTIEARTAQGERVRLYPNGRWEYVDAEKADAQRPVVERFDRERDQEMSRAKSLEQGGLMGIGRKLKPGDADYNRGSLGGKSK